MNTVESRLLEISRVPILLVATDYDGTISPIVEDPRKAHPDREAIVALRMLASLAQTHVAVISGRALADLAGMAGLPSDIHLVGSHGSEFDLDYAIGLPIEAKSLYTRVETELEQIARAGNGLVLEKKPASIALHYRQASREDAHEAVSATHAGPGSIEGVYTKHGKKVIELSVVATDKGTALDVIRQRSGASATLFLGDDQTDEDAFAKLRGPDLAVKVGPGESIAPYRIDGPKEVARVLAQLGELRAAWLEGAEATCISDHSLLSDQRAVALVTSGGRINWMCAPRADSAPVFAELIGGAAAGHFTVRPASGEEAAQQEYEENSLVLRTTWPGLTVTDTLDCSSGRPKQRSGRSDLIRVIEGNSRITIEFAPRLDFGRTPTRLRSREGGLEVDDSLDPIVLRSPGVTWQIEAEGMHHTARAEIQLSRSEPLVLEFRYGSAQLRDDHVPFRDRIRITHRYWSTWAEQLSTPLVHQDLVRRSALFLRGLCHGPTGAILAAATTSLPEHIGGVRNWDYRYCWLRDSAMTASSLVRLGSFDEAMAFLNWMCGVADACESPERLQPLYTITGGELLPEAEIAELSGYLGSRPVRVGNAASRQVQLDVFGPVVELIANLIQQGAPLSSEHWRLVESMVTAVERRWGEPDHGIWEIRRPRRHHVHSKVMCWLTVDRAITVARYFLERDMPHWEELRSRIAQDVLEQGFKPEVGAFTAAYDGLDLDAAALHVGLSGLVPASDHRFLSTIEAIEHGLRDGPTVYRYREDDGLPGFEGGFHICMGWLIQSYIQTGRRHEAGQMLDELCSLVGPTGMLSEQYDPARGQSLGNTPQAFSHLAVIDTALRLAESD